MFNKAVSTNIYFMKNFISTILLLFIIVSVKGQDVPFEKALFKERKDEFKIAKKNIDDGDYHYNTYPPTFIGFNQPEYGGRAGSYKAALPFYLKANKFNPNNAELNYKIGRCYLSDVKKTNCVTHFEKALKLNPNVAADIQYYLGIGYHLNEEFDKALKAFNAYKNILQTKNAAEIEDINKRINECETAIKLKQKPERVFIDNIGSTINTKDPEYGAIISADESVMMFTSRRQNTTGGNIDLGLNEYFEDIYITNKENGKWTIPQNIGEPVNSNEHDATVAISPDGQSMIIYNDDKGDGNLYECKLEGESWSKPKKMSRNINTKYHESSASYSADGKILYFVSAREGGLGGRDIYVTEWDEVKSDWGEAKNIGAPINTKYNEESVIIHPDGKTLYFSSQGGATMGGYDIFKSTLGEDGKWTTPVNMGYPINTVDDDVFFVISASGRRGYYSSFKDDGFGEKDIYVITFLGPEKPSQLSSEDNLIASLTKPVSEKVIEKQVDVATKRITILKGVVREYGTLKPIGASIELIDVEENNTLATFKSNNKTGKYLVSLPSGKNYGLAVKAPGYLFHSENFNIPDSAAYTEIVKNIDLKSIEIGNTIVLKNIFYDYNKATLRKASMNELDRLVKLLEDNPTLKIELSAHTDSRGGDKYNLDLSEKRAKSCATYLIEKGISADRLVDKGYGESKLLMTDTEISKLSSKEEKEFAHQQNRRTEFKILAK